MSVAIAKPTMSKPVSSPAVGLAWLTWRRSRIVVSLTALYGIALAAVLQTTDLPPAIDHCALIPLAWGVLYMLAALIGADADLVSAESAFPRYMLPLPMRTSALVAWQMVYGIAPIAFIWMLSARFILAPMGVAAPLIWPAFALGAIIAVSQLISWAAMPLRYIRGIIAMLALPAVIGFAALGAIHVVSQAAEYIVNAMLILGAYDLSVKTVSMTRRGDTPSWALQNDNLAEAIRLETPTVPFRSPMAAQVWFEWKRHGMSLAMLCGGMFLLTIPAVFMHQTVRLGGLPEWSYGILGIRVSNWAQALLDFSVLPLLFACVPAGSAKGKAWRQDLKVNTFGAARPLTSMAFVVARLRTAWLSTLAAWGVSGLVVAVTLSLPAANHHIVAPLAVHILHYMTPQLWFASIICAVLAVGLTWKFQVDSLFTELSGETWLAMWVYPFAVATLIPLIFAIPAAGMAYPSLLKHAITFLPAVIIAAALIKLPLAIAVVCTLIRRGLMPTPTFIRMAAIWAIVALVIFCALVYAIPASMVSTGLIAASVFLMMPVVRIGLAPLAWEWNRHR